MQTTSQIKIRPEELSAKLNDYSFRRKLAKTFPGFNLVYLPHHFELPPADFHPELMAALADHFTRWLLIEGFRGSAKSTIASLALPLWLALEHPDRYPFILPIADTSLQSGINIANIKTELDHNMLIKQDYGNIQGEFVEAWDLEGEEDWQAKNMLLSSSVRILARSRGQKVRGLRHRQHRPKAAIIDDPEDLDGVATKEKRDKSEKWLRGEVLPGLDEQTGRCIVIGNRLHADSLIVRLENDPLFKVLKYPILRPGMEPEHQRCAWPAKYPNQAALENQKKLAGAAGWSREYLLEPVPEEGAEVLESDLQFYETLPVETELGLEATALDLAISKKQTADYTAAVTGKTATIDGHFKIYIQPSPLNQRWDLHQLTEWMKAETRTRPLNIFYVEAVQYQLAAIAEMERDLLPVEGVQPIGDKRARLKVAAKYIKNGTVLFPKHGCEDLLIQLLHFGTEAHDDLVDALVYLILKLVESGQQSYEAVGV